MLTEVHGGISVRVCQGLGGVLIPKSGLACCKGPQPLVFCIETDRRACWCLVRGGLLGLVEVEVEEEERRVIA